MDVVYNLVLSIVCQWENYDEHTSCKMEHILRFRLCVALQKRFDCWLGRGGTRKLLPRSIVISTCDLFL